LNGATPILINDCRVLIIDDNEHSRHLIGSILAAANIPIQEFAGDGLEGLAKVSSFEPDIIVLDIMMPRMDGLEFLNHLRRNPNWGTIPVLVQTALGSPEDRNRIYQAGATDMLTKPISAGELIMRVRTHLENRLLTRSYQNRLRLEAEINAARQMQEALLPPLALLEEIRLRTSIRIDSHFETSSELGGDYWGVHDLAEDQLGIFTVDFSGHGVGAALNTFRLHAVMSNLRPHDDDPAAYLAALNNQLKPLLPSGQFATIFYGIINTRKNSLIYSAAGSPFPLIGRQGSADIKAHDAGGLPLAMKKDAAYENRHVDFPPGSFLFLYSDALIETAVTDGAVLDEDDLKALLWKSMETEPEAAALERLTGKFHEMMTGSLDDDLTVVLARRETIY